MVSISPATIRVVNVINSFRQGCKCAPTLGHRGADSVRHAKEGGPNDLLHANELVRGDDAPTSDQKDGDVLKDRVDVSGE